MKKRSLWILSALLVFACLAFNAGRVSYAKGPRKLAILPFNMNADRDLTFLREGIMDMLASRLAWKGEVEVLEKGAVKKEVAGFKGPVDKEKALRIGRALGVDYVIIGSLTVFGESVSLDARILDVSRSEELITAFKQTKGMDEVIPTVNQFALDINEKIMGRYIRPRVQARAPEAPRGPGGLVPVGEDFEQGEVGHVQRFPVEIIGLDVGDVDGDGKNELVFINKDTVFVYKWAGKAFVQFKKVKGGWYPNYVHVNVADLDRNGRGEIYVSNLGESDVSSLVLEWDGSRFKRMAKGQPWFFRVMNVGGQGPRLIGQKRKTGGGFRGDVQFLKREEDRFTPSGPVRLPRYGNIYNFAFAHLGGAGKTYTVMLDPTEYLRLYGPDLEEVWRSEEYYGGTTTFMETGGTEKSYIFMPSPIYITDVDGDGEKEVMICKNRSKARRLFARLRLFSSGTLHFLTWNQVGLSTKWTSKKLGGPIVGYKVSEVDNDGLQELVIASVIRGAHVLGRPRSQVVVYDLK